MNNKFYQKDWLMWLMFAIFIPVGVVLMWVNSRYKKAVRVIVSLLYLFLFSVEYNVLKDYNNGFAIFIGYVLVFVLLPYVIVHWKQLHKRNFSDSNTSGEQLKYNYNNEYKKTSSQKSIGIYIVGVILVTVGFLTVNSPHKNVESASQPAQNTTKQEVKKVDNANLQADLRDKLKDNAIQIEDSTDSTGYILIKNKCQADTRSRISYETYLMLNEARQRPEYKKCNKIGVMITADLTDKYGNTSNDKVYMQDFDKSELDKVNWDNIDENKMDAIGETPWYHEIINLDK
ncbi:MULTISPECIES: hypothetical protein [Clostridium]|uniref:Uncharacterized protein n=2 Tax=Clostridium TaxID=1485 RepID=D8GK28_CLOLD|nr:MULTISPECIES: hypothetical protein [Clostridium]ADK13146.1 hypothetical protein CLJU_c00390 [Clostridium ljungdahlii DSM 13528]AGY76370.1 hypothetical protein CAETHG_2157 [Clostridium autoethanogenum DSM 10061]ALU36533.1 Hypothetical protein CLAU_2104 [Clostridium autoethanogenum DSM 10061]OAA84385.1 hypothetical protein WX45_01048 [Clostridium ljungdahlii DSM 13528]OVY48619.1 hypothetical protein WX72_00440 [Clostridium autoethanogenum]